MYKYRAKYNSRVAEFSVVVNEGTVIGVGLRTANHTAKPLQILG